MKENQTELSGIIIASSSQLPRILAKPEASVAFCPEKGEAFSRISCALRRAYRVVDTLSEDASFEISYGLRLTGLPYVRMISSVDVIGEASDDFSASADCRLAVTDYLRQETALVAAAYGSIVSRLVRITDYRVSCLCKGEKASGADINALRRVIVGFYGKPPTSNGVMQAASAMIKPLHALDVEGGEEQLIRAVEMLLRREKRRSVPRYAFGLTCAHIVNQIYKLYLTTRFGMIAPPDNNARIDQAAEFLGADEQEIIKTLLPILRQSELDAHVNRISAHRAELLAEICYHELILRRAMGVIKRASSDVEGFSALEKSDLSIALALAPDLSLKSSGTLLAVMKNQGLLDNFLL